MASRSGRMTVKGIRSFRKICSLGLISLTMWGCGKSSDFSNKGDAPVKPDPEPAVVYAPAPRVDAKPIRGYDAPELSGQDLEYLADGKAKLEEPVDEKQSPVITDFTQGNATQTGDLNSQVAQGGRPLSCPGGVISGGHCYRGVSIYKWRHMDANDDSRIILSAQGEQCDPAKSAVCKLLQDSAVAGGFRTIDGVAFRTLIPEIDTNEARQGLVSLLICHGAVNTAGSESLLQVGEACQPVKETFSGLRTQAPGTVPAYLWQRGEYVILSLDNKNRPAPSFELKSTSPEFFILPAP